MRAEYQHINGAPRCLQDNSVVTQIKIAAIYNDRTGQRR